MKNELSKKNLNELKVIAKELNIAGYSNLRKADLVQKILESGYKQKKDKRIDFKWIVTTVIAMVAVVVGYQTCSNSSKHFNLQSKLICDSEKVGKFNEVQNFNITILDFEDYTVCTNDFECKNELAKQLVNIQEVVDYKIDLNVENCTSSDLGLYSPEDYTSFSKQTNSDVVIYGASEHREDSINVRLSYVVNPELRDSWIQTKKINHLKLQSKSIFTIFDGNEGFTLLKDIILWNIAQKVIFEDSIRNVQIFRNLLDEISIVDKELKSMSFVLKGISYAKEFDTIRSLNAFENAIKVDSINSEAYHHRGLLNLSLLHEQKALEDFFIANFISASLNVQEANSDHGVEKNKRKVSNLSLEAYFIKLIENKDEALAYSYLLGEAFRHNNPCIFVKHYYHYVSNRININELDKLLDLSAIEDKIATCD